MVDDLKGKRTGYGAAFTQLGKGFCVEFPMKDGGARPFAYRLSGPLQPRVCGVHLKNDYRLAFTARTPHDADPNLNGYVEVLYVGTRDTRDRTEDVWDIVHGLFEVENPKTDHLRPPCCEGSLPSMDEAEVQAYMKRLAKFLR